MPQPTNAQLQNQITALSNALASETTARVNAVSTEIVARNNADATEATRAQNIEGGLAQRMSALEDAVALLETPAAPPPVIQPPPPVVVPPPVVDPPPVVAVPDGVPADITALPRTNGVFYEFGDLFTYPAPNGGAAHAEYTVNGTDVKNHFWGSRWYDGKYEVKNSIASLLAAKLLPPYAIGMANITPRWKELGLYGADSLPIPLGYTGPMDYELPPYIGQTGDNPGIGWEDEWSAGRIATDNSALDASVSAIAHNGLTIPMFVRDPKTGRPVSFIDYPGICFYPNQENSMISPGLRTGIIGFTPDPPGISWDSAHHPAFYPLAALQTKDPAWLEAQQYLCTLQWAYDYPQTNAQHVDNLQVREMAHDIRTICDTIVLTRYFESLGLLPPSCHPSQYFFDVMLTPTIKWLMNFTGDTSPLGYSKVLQYAPYVYAPWQWDFLAIALGAAIYQGIPELLPIFNWVKAGLVERLTGKLGWNPRYVSFYYLNNPAGWDTAFASVLAGDPSLASDDPTLQFPTALLNGYTDYVGYAGAAARVGKLIGDPDLITLSPLLDARIKASGIPINYRHCIGA